MVPVVIHLVVVDGEKVAVIVRVETVPRVVVHLVPSPVPLLVAVRVNPEVVVVDVRVVNVAVDIDVVEDFVVALVNAEPTDLIVLVGVSKSKSTACGKVLVSIRNVKGCCVAIWFVSDTLWYVCCGRMYTSGTNYPA